MELSSGTPQNWNTLIIQSRLLDSYSENNCHFERRVISVPTPTPDPNPNANIAIFIADAISPHAVADAVTANNKQSSAMPKRVLFDFITIFLLIH